MQIREQVKKAGKKLHVYKILRYLYIFISAIRIHVASIVFKEQYASFYARKQNQKAANDPQLAVGGLWEQMGKLQLDYMISKGLKPEHTLLDLGCGSMRAGIWFIRYLETGKYWGIDISTGILDAGRRYISEANLDSKEPHLIINHDLSFDELSGMKFDFILAQSVFTHMPPQDIEDCFRNIGKILKPSGVFFATFNEGKPRFFHVAKTTFCYEASLFEQLGDKYGYQVHIDPSFIHPRKQVMLAISSKQ